MARKKIKEKKKIIFFVVIASFFFFFWNLLVVLVLVSSDETKNKKEIIMVDREIKHTPDPSKDPEGFSLFTERYEDDIYITLQQTVLLTNNFIFSNEDNSIVQAGRLKRY